MKRAPKTYRIVYVDGVVQDVEALGIRDADKMATHGAKIDYIVAVER